MIETFLNGKVMLHAGDSRDVLKTLGDCSIDSIVTDPPYALVSIVKRFGKSGSAAVKVPEGGSGAYARASAGFMGKKWDTGETAFAVEFWAECLRVLKPGGHVAAFSGTRTYHRLACAIEDAGFEIRDQLAWCYGSGFPKSHDVSKGIDKAAGAEREVVGVNRGAMSGWNADGGTKFIDRAITAPATDAAREWEGWGTALKPSWEPICFARKPLSESTVAANVLRWRTGALNIDGCRVETDEDRRRNARGGENGLTGTGTFKIRERRAEEQPQTAGRWPANVCHDGSDEVVAAFPSNSARFFFNASDELCTQNNASDAELRFPQANELVGSVLKGAVEQSTPQLVLKSIDFPAPFTSVTPSELKQTSARLIEMIQSFAKKCSRESLPAKLTLSDSLVSIAAVCERIDTITITISLSKSNGSVAPVTFNITLTNSEVGAKDSAPSSARFHYSAKASKADRAGSKHPTVKPIDLKRWLARLITPPGGTVLDPFAGSGTTGAACRLEGFSAVLIEREAEYQQDIRNRFATSADLLEAAE